MVSLGQVMNSLISQINKGRSQADATTVEVAELYKDDPFLSNFSVPRMKLDEVVIDLKAAISTGPTRAVSFTPKSKKKIVKTIKKVVKKDLPERYRYLQSMPQDPDIWEPMLVALERDLDKIVPAEVEMDSRSVIMGATAAIQRNVIQSMAHPKFKITRKGMGSFVEKDVPRMEKFVEKKVEAAVKDAVESQPPPQDRFEVLVSASDLEKIPPNKISNVRITLRESDLSWTEIETEKGVKKKLVPY